MNLKKFGVTAALDALGCAVGAKVQRHAPMAGDRVKDPAVEQVAVVQVRKLIAVARLDGEDALAVGHRGLEEKHGVNRPEKREITPRPRPSDSTLTTTRPGLRRSERMAWRMMCPQTGCLEKAFEPV